MLETFFGEISQNSPIQIQHSYCVPRDYETK